MAGPGGNGEHGDEHGGTVTNRGGPSGTQEHRRRTGGPPLATARGCSGCAGSQPVSVATDIRQGDRQARPGYPQGAALYPHRMAVAGCLGEQPEAPTVARKTAGRTERDSRRDSARESLRVSGALAEVPKQPSAHTGAVDNPNQRSRPGRARHPQPRTVEAP